MDTNSFPPTPPATADPVIPPATDPPISPAQEPPEFDMKGYAKSFAKNALDNLAEILTKQLDDGSPRYGPLARSAAAKEILDRGYGKAKQELETKHVLTYQDLLKRIGEREQKWQQIVDVEYKEVPAIEQKLDGEPDWSSLTSEPDWSTLI